MHHMGPLNRDVLKRPPHVPAARERRAQYMRCGASGTGDKTGDRNGGVIW